MTVDLLESVNRFAEEVRKAEFDYSEVFDRPGRGLEVVFDGVFTWSFSVKVRKPWRVFGTITQERHQIFQRKIRSHIVTAALAEELANPLLDQSLSVVEELSTYNFQLAWPDQVSWPLSVYNWEDDENEEIDFQILDSSAASLWSMIALEEDEVLVSRSIEGFEGRESGLASIHRRKQAFLDGSAWEEDASLETVTLVNESQILLDGLELSVTDSRVLLENVANLLP